MLVSGRVGFFVFCSGLPSSNHVCIDLPDVLGPGLSKPKKPVSRVVVFGSGFSGWLTKPERSNDVGTTPPGCRLGDHLMMDI